MARLPAELAGPVVVQLSKLVETIPGEAGLPGGSVYEPKWDGYRCVIVRTEDAARLWSRQGKDLTTRFSDVAAAAVRQLPAGAVVDGELVVFDRATGRLDFDALQLRLVTAARKASRKATLPPASYVAFDLLAVAGVDVRSQRWSTRRQRLESLAGWSPPLQLSPVTRSLEEARDWYDVLPEAIGVEGLVVKGAGTRYQPGRRDGWFKVKRRDTHEVVVGGVLGPIAHPQVVIAGLYRADGELVQVGRTVPLTPKQSTELGAVLLPAGPEHPWPAQIGTGRWGARSEKVELTRVEPSVVVEISADAAQQTGQWRHPLRLVRPRPDLQPFDLDPLPTSSAIPATNSDDGSGSAADQR